MTARAQVYEWADERDLYVRDTPNEWAILSRDLKTTITVRECDCQLPVVAQYKNATGYGDTVAQAINRAIENYGRAQARKVREAFKV